MEASPRTLSDLMGWDTLDASGNTLDARDRDSGDPPIRVRRAPVRRWFRSSGAPALSTTAIRYATDPGVGGPWPFTSGGLPLAVLWSLPQGRHQPSPALVGAAYRTTYREVAARPYGVKRGDALNAPRASADPDRLSSESYGVAFSVAWGCYDV